MQIIKEWLNSFRDYQDGVALYMEHGQDPILKKSFKEARTVFKEKKLAQVLTDLLKTAKRKPIPENKQVVLTMAKPAAVESFKYWPAVPIENPVVAALHEKWKPLFLEMQNIQARIYDVAIQGETDTNKKMEACQMVHRMLDLDDLCDDIYQARDHYYNTGQLPRQAQEPDEIVGDPIRWVTLLKNAQRYIREYKTKSKADPTNEKTAAKLLEWEAVESKYKNLTKITMMAQEIEKSTGRQDAKKTIIRFLTTADIMLTSDHEKILARWELADFYLRQHMDHADIILKITAKFAVSKFTAENDISSAQEVFAKSRKVNKKYVLHLHLQRVDKLISHLEKSFYSEDQEKKVELTEKMVAAMAKLYDVYTHTADSLPDDKTQAPISRPVFVFQTPPTVVHSAMIPLDQAMQQADEYIESENITDESTD